MTLADTVLFTARLIRDSGTAMYFDTRKHADMRLKSSRENILRGNPRRY